MLDYSHRQVSASLVSAFAVEVGPLAGLDETGPVKGVGFRIPLEHVQLHLT